MLARGLCALCGAPYETYGNNPDPLGDHDDRVCDSCNERFVIPARLRQLTPYQVTTLMRTIRANVSAR
jgi:hypothetical protein